MSDISLLQNLIDSLTCLPSVGKRTAQRMAFHILENDRAAGLRLSTALSLAIENIHHCQRCRTLTEHDLCRLCLDKSRDETKLCIVESPTDVLAIEQSAHYRGYYFVLMGKLSPLDGIGPDELELDKLDDILAESKVEELILATSPSIEGEVTAHYISQMAVKRSVKMTRIAHGVPIGGELDYVDKGTLSHAFSGRQQY